MHEIEFELLIDPDGQGAQTEPEIENVPAGQDWQLLDEFEPTLNVIDPRGQDEHADDPASAAKVPKGQTAQEFVVAPTIELKKPRLHRRQSVPPDDHVPAPHRAHPAVSREFTLKQTSQITILTSLQA